MWEPTLLEDDEKRKKSFWLAIAAVQKFFFLRANKFLQGWNLATYKDKPAVELSFIITFPNGFTYKGYVDAVLVNELTGEVMVLECKTTSSYSVNSAQFKNSAQAIGYSVALDAIFSDLSSYEVQYLVYKTKSMEFETMRFQKDYLSRALWIREILMDIDILSMYEEAGIYPMYGESCNDFNRECEYFGICTLSTRTLTEPLTQEQEAQIELSQAEEFQIILSLNDLIQSQLSKE